MFRLLINLVLLLAINTVFSQKTDEAIFFSQKKQINKFHTISDLEAIKKGDLITLYQDRVEEIITVLPFLSLTNEPGIRLRDIGIKEDSRHLKTLKNSKTDTEKNIESANVAIEELVAYADTEKIIWAILYFEEVIKKMRIGASGNF
ncbi:hypothetical protein [Aquimarina mytili]|uniref:Uncharacterized protein n=1 Tax=Aquimarina mytili TaxID=874423 RepID=A0A936ZQM1_9FLAO|nr:hypothetical protein [Aquimarina mytili]MBL0683627.1 hypothetical protein [Aquimarina mytili]